MSDVSEHLRGPWVAVLSERYGTVYDSVEDADEGEELEVSVVRGSAAPRAGQMPGSYQSGDVALCWEDLSVDGDADSSTGAAARFEQAKAMAAGLNAAWHATEPGA